MKEYISEKFAWKLLNEAEDPGVLDKTTKEGFIYIWKKKGYIQKLTDVQQQISGSADATRKSCLTCCHEENKNMVPCNTCLEGYDSNWEAQDF